MDATTRALQTRKWGLIMPNSLKVKIDKLKYQGKITEEEHRELVEKLKGHDAELVGKSDVLDKIRAEIKAKIEEEEFARSIFRHEEKDTVKAEQCTGSIMAYNNVIRLIDKYKAESEE